MAGFKYVGQLNGAENPVLIDVPIMNDATITLGDAVDIHTTGGCQPADAGDKVFGIVIGLVDINGTALSTTPSAEYDGTYSGNAGQVGSETYVAASDNLTDKQIKVKLIIDLMALFENDSAGDMAYTDDFQFFDLLDEDQIADQDGHATAGAFQLIRRDADDASKGIFRIAESGLHPYAQQ